MAEVRYELPGVPPQVAAVGLSAFMPHLARQAAGGAQSYKYAVNGYPGTRAIPAPTAGTQMASGGAAVAGQGTARSSDAPPAWFPNTYWQGYAAEYPGAGQDILLVDPVNPGPASLLPVPAVDPAAAARPQAYQSPRMAGIVQRVRSLPWPPRLGGGGG